MAPSLNIIDHDLLYRRSESESDLMSQSGSISQTHSHHSVRSSATNRLRRSTNSKSSDPTTLSFYRGTTAYEILSLAKDYFVVGTFSAGLFFYHKRSLYLDAFKSKANDALALAAWERNSRCFTLIPIPLHWYCCIQAHQWLMIMLSPWYVGIFFIFLFCLKGWHVALRKPLIG